MEARARVEEDGYACYGDILLGGCTHVLDDMSACAHLATNTSLLISPFLKHVQGQWTLYLTRDGENLSSSQAQILLSCSPFPVWQPWPEINAGHLLKKEWLIRL